MAKNPLMIIFPAKGTLDIIICTHSNLGIKIRTVSVNFGILLKLEASFSLQSSPMHKYNYNYYN